MQKKNKRLAKLRRNPRNTSLKDFESVIKQYGCIEEGSKHPKAIIGKHTMAYKRENPVKSCYVTEMIDIIDSLSI